MHPKRVPQTGGGESLRRGPARRISAEGWIAGNGGLLAGSRLREIGRRPMKKCRAGLQKQRETHTIKASQL